MTLSIITYGPTNLGQWYNYDSTYFYDYDLNDADDKIGFGFQSFSAGTITEVGFITDNIIGSCPEDYQLGIVTLEYDPAEYTSVPTSTLYGGSSWQTFNPYTYGSGWNWITLSSYVTITAGDMMALVIKPGTVVPDSSNFVSIRDGALWYRYPWGPEKYYFSTSWNDDDGPGQAALKLLDGSFIGFPVLDLASFTLQSPEEWGLEFTLPLNTTCVGTAIIHQEEAFGTDVPYTVLLTDSNDNTLRSDVVTNSEQYGGGYDSEATRHFWEEIELSAGTPYRIVLKPTSAKYVMGVGYELIEEQYKDCFPGGTDWKWIYRPAPTSGWQYLSNKYPWISLILTNLGGSVVDNSYGFIG